MPFLVEDLIQEDIKYLTTILKDGEDEIKGKMDGLLFNFEQFIKTGNTVFLQNELRKHNNINENVEPIIPMKKPQEKKGVLTDITESNIPIAIENVKIKLEKMSDVFPGSKVNSLNAVPETSDEIKVNSTVNSNNEEEMPPPKHLPLRKRKIKEEPVDMPKCSTRTRRKPKRYTANEEVNDGKLSDVVIQNTDITTIDVTNESDKDVDCGKAVIQPEITTEEEKQVVEPIRSKRAKTVKSDITNESVKEVDNSKAVTQPEITTEEKQVVEPTRSRRTRIVKNDVSNESDKEVDSGKAVTQPEITTEEEKQEVEPIRSKRTRTVKKIKTQSAESQNDPLPIKQNMCIEEKDNKGQNECNKIDNEIQSLGNQNSTCVKTDGIQTSTPGTPQKPKKKKEIFSPFDKVSTKEKVKAFEKFNAAPVSPPSVRTRADKVAEQKDQKYVTPNASKLLNKVHSTTKASKFIHRDDSSSSNNSLLASKSQSALKAFQAEFRERVKKKKEKEEEALKKREAMLLALSEEKKKKREEKQLKAQQQREIIEKEKLKQMEAQKLKEEKYKQAVAEKEEKLQKQKEAEKKLLLSKKRAGDLKIRERNGLKLDLPLYMTTQAPLLPTDDCYDSDDESERSRPQKIPAWSSDYELKRKQIIMLKIGEQIKNTFFSRQVHTPDLREIFERIDPKTLKRTSSAIWRKPPRYTFFLETSTVQFSEDDE